MKIKIVAQHKHHIQLEPLLRPKVLSILQDHKIHIVESRPDVILYHTYKAGPEHKRVLQEKNIPILILERIASARILSRSYIGQDNVKGILKSTIYRDLNIENTPYMVDHENYPDRDFKNNYHTKLIFDSFNKDYIYLTPQPALDDSELKKVKLWYNFCSYEMMHKFMNHKKSTSNKRKVDISFYGTTTYGPRSLAITTHRQRCIKKLKKINGNVDQYSGRKPKDQYISSLINSKIGISPWGLGEKCYRDFEAIFSGSILVKPDTSFVLDWMDTYNLKNKLYIPCEIDFSDLQEKVDYIKTNWIELDEFRLNAFKYCKTFSEDEKIALHIISVLNKCII